MKLNIHNKIGAKFKLVARKASGDIARESEWFDNIVLDTGLARMSVGAWVTMCCVGTGNSTPLATQVQLDSFLASTNARQSGKSILNTSTSPYYFGIEIIWRFGMGAAAGNLSEIGLGWGNNNLWNRALIRDVNGNPTTITVLADEYLDVVSEIRVYPTENFSGAFNLLDKNGSIISNHTYIGKPFLTTFTYNPSGTLQGLDFNEVHVYSGAIGSSITALPSNQLGTLSNTKSNPTPTSAQALCTASVGSSIGSHKSIYVGLQYLLFVGSPGAYTCGYQIEMTPPIGKTNTQIMTYTFNLTWGRYEPS